jgi:23S rRNA (guanosine2251-2'-O)-methyltransferase
LPEFPRPEDRGRADIIQSRECVNRTCQAFARAPKSSREAISFLPPDGFNRAMTRRPFPSRSTPDKSGLWLYGIHTVKAALANPLRRTRRCLLTRRVLENISEKSLAGIETQIVAAEQISRLLPAGAVHQGIALSSDPLPRRSLDEIIAQSGQKIVLVLDQIADPHNVGAILRSAAAFDAAAVIVQDRHAPAESGVLAKAASGGLDLVPYLPVVNIVRALEHLGDAGFWRVALGTGEDEPLSNAIVNGSMALVLGSEGAGLRRLVRERCDESAAIPIGDRMESLNVSNAAAIALYECRRPRPADD